VSHSTIPMSSAVPPSSPPGQILLLGAERERINDLTIRREGTRQERERERERERINDLTIRREGTRQEGGREGEGGRINDLTIRREGTRQERERERERGLTI